ncbi:hypothetical protein [Thermomicrobium sp.]
MRIAVRRIGSARLEIATVTEIVPWVAVPGPLGEEAAALSGEETALLGWEGGTPLPARPLGSDETARLAVLVAEASALAGQLAGLLPWRLVGLRPTLAGGLVIEVTTASVDERSEREAELARLLGRPIALVSVGEGALTGSTGRPAVPIDLEEAAMKRLLAGAPARPGGFPRIGTPVRSPHGSGVVWSVRTRDRTVLVRVGGETVRVPLADLVTDEPGS